MERNQTGSETDTDRVEGANEKDSVEVEEKLVEEIEWPCAICGKNVPDDGIKCAECEKWCHIEGCTDVVSPNDYRSKPYSCQKCSDKSGGKSKPKKRGRPKRERSNSLPSSQAKDWIANKDWIAKNIKNKRNIDEVGSPEKNRNKIGREEKEEGRSDRKGRR